MPDNNKTGYVQHIYWNISFVSTKDRERVGEKEVGKKQTVTRNREEPNKEQSWNFICELFVTIDKVGTLLSSPTLESLLSK